MTVSTNYTFVPFINNSDSYTTDTKVKDGSILGKDDFLKLLITQLRYQNPLEPMDNNEYIAQMASFSALEQMTNLNTSFNKLALVFYDYLIPQMQWQHASQMLGKEVTYLNPSAEDDAEEFLSGVIESILTKDGQIYFMINGSKVPVVNVTEILSSKDSSQALLEDILDKIEKLVNDTSHAEDETDG